ncbi:MAG: hypothetical protein R3C56_20935 [Pirellulaceae bacterium]
MSNCEDESTAGHPTASHGFSTADIELLAEICDQTALLTTRFRSHDLARVATSHEYRPDEWPQRGATPNSTADMSFQG